MFRPRRPPRPILKARQLLQEGRFAEAAVAFDRLAQGAEERGVLVSIPQLFLAALFAMTILWWYGALALEDATKRQAGLGMFLIFLSALILHDSYGNRLLPPPNHGAQVMGYTEGLLCLVLGIRMVTRNLWKSK